MHPRIEWFSLFSTWAVSTAYVHFLIFKCNVKWSMTPLMSSLDASLRGTMKCHLSGLSSFVSCPYTAAWQEQGGSGFCFWAVPQRWLCCGSHRAANAASWGPSGSQFLYTLHAARAWSHILFLAKSLVCFMYMGTGELGPKTTKEREAEFCEEITESPILLKPKQSDWPELQNHTRRGRINV